MASFWNHVIFTLKVTVLIVQVLRLERKTTMGYIYEAMEKAKETIMKSFNNNESKYNDVFTIIDNRWTCQLHHPLHAAGHFLNPAFYYSNPDMEYDLEVTNGWIISLPQEWLVVEVDDDNDNEEGGNELATVYEASSIGEPIVYTRRQATNKRKQPSSGGIVIGSSHASEKGPDATPTPKPTGKALILILKDYLTLTRVPQMGKRRDIPHCGVLT
ncbi:hypothetical protein V8G54_003650 [Vigna mungo]|uniref:Uncharacterized protein n=1 Tax=Vigna mungo TaxID=3915 RepID=A0AAQ3PAE6_VIGMU